MKNLFFLFITVITISVFSCKSEINKDNVENNIDKTTKLKITKQFVTDNNGLLNEVLIDGELIYSKKEISFEFSKKENSFVLKVDSISEKADGTTLFINDNKYKEVFVSSGNQPQITLIGHEGTSNIAFM